MMIETPTTTISPEIRKKTNSSLALGVIYSETHPLMIQSKVIDPETSSC